MYIPDTTDSPALRVSVVVPVRNRPDYLEAALRALVSQDLPSHQFEVLVCDDGSTDDISPVVARCGSSPVSIRTVRQPPKGPAAARNLGIRHSSGKVVVFIDSDVVPRPGVVRLLARALDENPSWCGAEAALLPTGDHAGLLWDAPDSEGGGHFHTAAIAYRRDVLLDIGGLDEAFPLPACEDVELAVRALEHGPIGFVPEAIAEHPRRRVDLQTHWKWRRHWRYSTILAVRYGILGFPGNPAGSRPRLRVARAAVLSLPMGRLLASVRSAASHPATSLIGILYAIFDVWCGIWALPDILLAPIPSRRGYLSSGQNGTG